MSKNFQEKFTEASRIYLALEDEIREMYRFDTKPRIKLDDYYFIIDNLNVF